ncbi:MAG: GNAT family N-acetyltransferase [Chloroflexaceae bacterium]|nr:GNAT family N-acetyltransferase [Chloroflexaceae bacterium]
MTQPALTYSPPQPTELDALNRVIGTALYFSIDYMHGIFSDVGVENFRVVRRGGRVVGGVGLIPMGEWFGGASIPMVGISTVGIAPDQRGTGVGRFMLSEVVHELYATGVPIAGLYPATQHFYRTVGFERAGSRIRYELPLEVTEVRLLPPTAPLEVIPVDVGDTAAYEQMKQVYTAFARSTNGLLDRIESRWQRSFEPILQTEQSIVLRFLVLHEGQPEGYVVYTQTAFHEPLQVVDWAVTTPRAAHQLLRLFAGSRSTTDHVRWNGGLFDPLVYALREQRFGLANARASILQHWDWMLRIVDLVRALSLRPYPPGLAGELHLEVADDLLPANNGRFVLQIADGRGMVERGGAGRLRLDIRDMAPLYSSFMTPHELRLISTLDGLEPDMMLATAAFAGPRPWMSEIY